jgi:hypothetical protein
LSALGAGTAAPDWNPTPGPGTSWYLVTSVCVAGTNLFVCGNFTQIGGINRNYLAKLDANGAGAVDPVWNPNPAGGYAELLVSDQSQVVVAGGFTNIGGQNMRYLSKLNCGGTGEADPGWTPAIPCYPEAMTVVGTNLLVYGYDYSNPGHYVLARLSMANPGLRDDPVGDPNPTLPYTKRFALAADEVAIYVGGNYSAIGGASRNGLARFDGVPLGPFFRNPRLDPDAFRMEIGLEPGQLHRLQTSTNLSLWTDLTNLVSDSPIMTFQDCTATNDPRKFFRIVPP